MVNASQILTKIFLFLALTRVIDAFQQPLRSLYSRNKISDAHHVSKPNIISMSMGEVVDPTNIGKAEMAEILEDVANGGREETGYVVMDVRNPDEIAATGKLSEDVQNLPLPLIVQLNVFSLDEDEFEEVCGFQKPALDETLVFSCLAGSRSVQAAGFAAQSGYSNIVNYKGGAKDWFDM